MGARGEQIRRMIFLIEMLLVGLKLKNCGYFSGTKRSPSFFQSKRSDHPRALIFLYSGIFQPLMIALHEFLMPPFLTFDLIISFCLELPILRKVHQPFIVWRRDLVLALTVEVDFSAARQGMDVGSYKFLVVGCLGALRGLAEVGRGVANLLLIQFAGLAETRNELMKVYCPYLLLFLLRTSIHFIITYLSQSNIKLALQTEDA